MKYKKIIGSAAVLMLVPGLTACNETQPVTEEPVGKALNIVVDENMAVKSTVNGLTDGLCSFTKGGTDASTIEGDDYSFIPTVYINEGSYDNEKSVTDENLSNDKLTDTSIVVNKESVNGIIVNDSTYEIDNVDIEINADNADGSTTCDFTGLGTALAVFGDSSVNVRNTVLKASGTAGMGVLVDNGSSVLFDNVEMNSKGGTLYESYYNNASQDLMVAPPWILGIMGTSRSSNLVGKKSTFTVLNSSTSASNWAVLSTDSCSDGVLNVVNSSLTLTGTDRQIQAGGKFDTANPYTSRNGYGTYVIGDATENFLGAKFNVGTYASIFTGGTAYFGNLENGKTYDLLKADGTTHTTYTATEDVKTEINSDTFGFMFHQNTNKCTVDGAIVNSGYTSFLVKSGNNAEINVENGASINPGNGILLQLMDNDDKTTEFNTTTMAFGEYHEENAGFPTEAVSTDSTDTSRDEAFGAGEQGDGEPPEKPDSEAGEQGDGEAPEKPESGAGGSSSNTTVFNVADTALEGSIYNGIGWNANKLSNGNVQQMSLKVNLSGTSSLRGSIASTGCIHVSYDGQAHMKNNGMTAFTNDDVAAAFADQYQLTKFGQNEYFNIGQVANLVKSNGLNTIDVTLSGTSIWTATGTSLVNSVSLSDDAKVIVESGSTLIVNGKEYGEGTYGKGDF